MSSVYSIECVKCASSVDAHSVSMHTPSPSLLQNIVSFIGLFCKRDLWFYTRATLETLDAHSMECAYRACVKTFDAHLRFHTCNVKGLLSPFSLWCSVKRLLRFHLEITRTLLGSHTCNVKSLLSPFSLISSVYTLNTIVLSVSTVRRVSQKSLECKITGLFCRRAL